jgi:hypothetical protein
MKLRRRDRWRGTGASICHFGLGKPYPSTGDIALNGKP